MGLRINTNVPAQIGLAHLRTSDRNLQHTLEQLSTGLRINHAQDDPAGLVISEILRTQVSSLNQAAENSQNAENLTQTAEAAINEVNTLVNGIRQSIIFALNTGGTSPDQVQAEQDSVNQAIQAIKRISDTTRFGETQLLNGNSSFLVSSMNTSGIAQVNPFSVQFDPTTNVTTFQVNVRRVASQARLDLGSNVGPAALVTSNGAAATQVTVRIRGPVGAEDVTLAPGTTVSQFARTINELRDNLGVYASADGIMRTETFGSSEMISLQVVRGRGTFFGGTGAPRTVGQQVTAFGGDAVATLGASLMSAKGNHLSFTDQFFNGTIDLNPPVNQLRPPGPGTVGSFNFRIRRSGLTFQFGANPTGQDADTIGLPNLDPIFLGQQQVEISGKLIGGTLDQLVAGQQFDLFSSTENLRNAARIVDASLNTVTQSRENLGAFIGYTVEPNIRATQVAIQNLTASESSIRDLDFAAATSQLVKNQILFQAGVSVLGQANQIPQQVIQLLQRA